MGNGDSSINCSSENLKVLINVNVSLANIDNSIKDLRDSMNNLTEMEKKQGIDLQLFNERIKILEEMRKDINEMKQKITMLVTQVDFEEAKRLKTEVLKQKMKEKEKLKEIPKEISKKKNVFINIFSYLAKNIKWISISIVALTVAIILLKFGWPTLKYILDSFFK